MASQGSEDVSEQTEEATQDEEDLRISPAEEMPADGPGDVEPEQLLLPWDRFSAWLHCICVVGFDLELGQAVEVIYIAVYMYKYSLWPVRLARELTTE
ncbi:DENN/MADD domain containing 6Aa, partial [Tachysurus ichikawai]